MTAKYVGRRLAVIFVADVVGFSHLVGRDEEGTLHRLQHLRNDAVDPIIRARSGRVIKSLGDGILAEFASVAEAVQAAVEIQRAVATRNAHQKPDAWIEFRIGIHNGDVTAQADGDLLGETVNIAARLEALAEPGGVCLSEDTYRQIRDRLAETCTDLGDKKLKNIARPIRAYAIGAAAATGKPPAAQPPRRSRGRKLPAPISVRSPRLRGKIDTVERACAFIDKNLPPDLAKLPRWTFARALFAEAMKTGKSRDLNTAVRQFRQALRNEKWLDEQDEPRSQEAE
ncbi:MAG TPA: adenylate/guanylate cyclase domain-containing protein [Xanthobacteraceae bacterium]|jgi:class 3 adenylate cyclase